MDRLTALGLPPALGQATVSAASVSHMMLDALHPCRFSLGPR